MTSSSAPPPTVLSDEAALAAAPLRLPHAPPFSLIDRVVSCDLAAGKLVAMRRLTANDALWPAAAPSFDRPFLPNLRRGEVVLLFPEVLIIEALSQAAACLNILDAAPDAARRHLGYLVAVSKLRFPTDFSAPHFGRASVGDTLILQVERQSRMGALVAFFATALIEAREVAAGQLMFAIAQD